MRSQFARAALVCAVSMGAAFPASAQAPAASAAPSGHWEGAVEVPTGPVQIEVDVARNTAGALAGTFGQPAQNVKGLPLSSVTLDGKTVTFVLKAGAEPSTFTGTLSDDGQTLAGNMTQGTYTFPFKLTRTGDAKVMAAPKSAAIAKEFEGTWNGALDVGGRQMRLIVKMANQADGTSSGTIASPDGSGIEIAIGMTQKDKDLTIDVPSINGSFTGKLNADGSELTGTWTQAGQPLPLVLKKAPK